MLALPAIWKLQHAGSTDYCYTAMRGTWLITSWVTSCDSPGSLMYHFFLILSLKEWLDSGSLSILSWPGRLWGGSLLEGALDILSDSLLWAEIHTGGVVKPVPRRYYLHLALLPSPLWSPQALLWVLSVCSSCLSLPCGDLVPLTQQGWPANDKYHLITEQAFLLCLSARLLLLKIKLHSNTTELPF